MPRTLCAGDGLQCEFKLLKPRQRAFRAHQQLRQIQLFATQPVDVVTGHVPGDLGIAPLDLFGMVRVQPAHPVGQDIQPAVAGIATALQQRAPRATGELFSIGEHRLDSQHIVDHVTVVQRAGADAVVAGHAADGRAA